VILTGADVGVYVTSSTALQLSSEELMAKIAMAQLFAEGFYGANRALELQSFTEILTLNKSGVVRLTNIPVTQIDSLETRETTSNILDPILTDWVLTATDQFVLDYNGQLSLRYTNNHFESSRKCQHEYVYQIRVTYSAGIDFSQTTPEISKLKYALGDLVDFILTPEFSGITRVQKHQDFEYEYGKRSTSLGNLPEYLLLPFQNYRIRSW